MTTTIIDKLLDMLADEIAERISTKSVFKIADQGKEHILALIQEHQLTMDEIMPHIQGRIDHLANERIKEIVTEVVHEKKWKKEQLKELIDAHLEDSDVIGDAVRAVLNDKIGDEIRGWFSSNNISTDDIERFESEVEDICERVVEDSDRAEDSGLKAEVRELREKVDELDGHCTKLMTALLHAAAQIKSLDTE